MLRSMRRCFRVFLVVWSFATLALADLAFTSYPPSLKSGTSYLLTWQGRRGMIDVSLIDEQSPNLRYSIYSGYSNTYTWQSQGIFNTTSSFHFRAEDDFTGNVTTTNSIRFEAKQTSYITTQISSQISSLPTSSLPTSAVSYSSTPSEPATPSVPPTIQNDNQTRRNGLDNGAIIGISLGGTGLLILLAIAVLLYKRRRLYPRREAAYEKPPIQYFPDGLPSYKVQLDGRPISYEMPS